LDYSEIDLWWILNKRARFLLDSRTRNLVRNEIVFFSIDGNREQCELLKTLEVEVIDIKLDKEYPDYEKAYNEIFKIIEFEKSKLKLK
jgi:hypothetical protein